MTIKGKVQIRTKINLLYFSVLVVSFIFTFAFLVVINDRTIEREAGSAGLQTVDVLKGNLQFIFDNVTQFSTLIYFDENMQTALSAVSSEKIDPTLQQRIKKSLDNMLLSGEYISSAFVFDRYYNSYSSYKVGPIQVQGKEIEATDWYKKMLTAQGDGFFIHKSEDILTFPTKPNKNYLCYIREIADVDTYAHLATLLLTIDEETLQAYFQEAGQKYQSQFFIVDGQGEYVIRPQSYEEELQKQLQSQPNNRNSYQTLHLGHQAKTIVFQDLGIMDWQIIGVFDMNQTGIFSQAYLSTIIFIILLNMVFVFICALVLSRFIFKPLSKVRKQMALAEDGHFIEMPVDPQAADEISSLKRVFNQMILAIQKLIAQVKAEEQIIARNELEIIQAQIQPHFLYNTLDAISALALLEDHQSCFHMTQALGSFYKNSLNSGMDMVAISDEIACIDSYITILNFRYENKITVTYEVEEELWKAKILKLILQPVVENAVHHGIKPKHGSGSIQIKVYRDEDEIIFIITDDGVGISEERLGQVLTGKIQTGKSGFGLYSLIQRISLYYHMVSPVTITSEIGSGTEVTIRVKILAEEELATYDSRTHC